MLHQISRPDYERQMSGTEGRLRQALLTSSRMDCTPIWNGRPLDWQTLALGQSRARPILLVVVRVDSLKRHHRHRRVLHSARPQRRCAMVCHTIPRHRTAANELRLAPRLNAHTKHFPECQHRSNNRILRLPHPGRHLNYRARHDGMDRLHTRAGRKSRSDEANQGQRAAVHFLPFTAPTVGHPRRPHLYIAALVVFPILPLDANRGL